MNPQALRRTWLYAPAHRPDIARKALTGAADAVMLDLEDAVPLDAKTVARHHVTSLVAEPRRDGVECWIRINDPGTAEGEADLVALAALPEAERPDGIRIPKAQELDTIRAVAELGLPLQLTVETALGLRRADELANAHPLVRNISLGEADLAADLGVTSDDGLDWARGWIVTASRAAGLLAPIQSVFTDLGDFTGLAADTRRWAARGFFGRSVIHPKQVAVVHDAIQPQPEDIAAARAVLAAAADAARHGSAATVDARGRFVDPAVVARARVTVAISDLYAQQS